MPEIAKKLMNAQILSRKLSAVSYQLSA